MRVENSSSWTSSWGPTSLSVSSRPTPSLIEWASGGRREVSCATYYNCCHDSWSSPSGGGVQGAPSDSAGWVLWRSSPFPSGCASSSWGRGLRCSSLWVSLLTPSRSCCVFAYKISRLRPSQPICYCDQAILGSSSLVSSMRMSTWFEYYLIYLHDLSEHPIVVKPTLFSIHIIHIN